MYGMTKAWQSAGTVDFGIPLGGERRYRCFACTTNVAEIRAEKKTGMTEEQRGDVRGRREPEPSAQGPARRLGLSIRRSPLSWSSLGRRGGHGATPRCQTPLSPPNLGRSGNGSRHPSSITPSGACRSSPATSTVYLPRKAPNTCGRCRRGDRSSIAPTAARAGSSSRNRLGHGGPEKDRACRAE